MATSKNQLSRLLTLIAYLQANPGIPVRKVAQEFGVTPEQISDDVKVLQFCGLPGQQCGDLIEVEIVAEDGEDVIYLENADFLTRPLRLTPDEAFALVGALAHFEHMADSQMAASVASARAKVSELLDDLNLEVSYDVVSSTMHVRDAITAALRNGTQIRLDYEGQSGHSTPTLEPACLREVDGVVYLQAWSLDASAWRTFRLDRIVAVTVLDTPAGSHGYPPTLDADWSSLTYAYTASLRVPARLRWVSEYYPMKQVTPIDDEYLLEFGVLDDRWLWQLLLRLGKDATDVTPAEAVVAARRVAAEALDMYGRLEDTSQDPHGQPR